MQLSKIKIDDIVLVVLEYEEPFKAKVKAIAQGDRVPSRIQVRGCGFKWLAGSVWVSQNEVRGIIKTEKIYSLTDSR